MLADQFKRKIDYLRVSVTDRCDLRCTYCMAEDVTFLSRQEVLAIEEIIKLIDVFNELGVKKFRLTGGEPLVRKNIISVIEHLFELKKQNKILEHTLTTNGTNLEKYSPILKQNGINRINVSLDTIVKDKYKEITRFGNLDNVLDGIEEAKKNGIKVKINTVVFKNFNENQISDLVYWANKKLIDITFIEVMPMNDTDMPRHMQFVSLENVYKELDKKFKFENSDYNTGGPSNYYVSL